MSDLLDLFLTSPLFSTFSSLLNSSFVFFLFPQYSVPLLFFAHLLSRRMASCPNRSYSAAAGKDGSALPSRLYKCRNMQLFGFSIHQAIKWPNQSSTIPQFTVLCPVDNVWRICNTSSQGNPLDTSTSAWINKSCHKDGKEASDSS